jgi:Heparinase II/III-like protein/Heparinase II/III N-terminus
VKLSSLTFGEIFDRSRQLLLAHAQGVPILGPWTSASRRYLDREASVTDLFSRAQLLVPEGVQIEARKRGLDAVRQADAERSLQGQFDLLGLSRLSFGNPVDWHLEPTSGRRSPLLPWKKLDSLDPTLTGDKKVVWELNRHQHLVRLAQAFSESGDERYARGAVEHIRRWIDANPIGLGINWVSSLELAFRCISWLWALSLLRAWSKWHEVPTADIAYSIHCQASHIERYLSTYSSPNTHLTGEALGLYYIGTCLPELRCAARWRALGRSILLQQLPLQVRDDGVYFEQTTWYHRYTAEFYLHFLLLAERSGDYLPGSVAQQLRALLDHLMWIARPDGTFPFIGDDDGGKLLKLDSRPANDWRALLCTGAVLFGRADYKTVAGEFADETFWLLGPTARATYEQLRPVPPAQCSRAFQAGGYFVMRSGWSADSNYLLLDCGPHGVMNYGHAHADALSIEVSALGEPVVIDPGTFVYTGSTELRDAFRSTAMHNTATIDGLSSSVSAGPFKWQSAAQCKLQQWSTHPSFSYFEGSHDGYLRLADPVTHTRALLFPRGEYWVMLDQFDGRAEHEYTLHFHLSAGVQLSAEAPAGWLRASSTKGDFDLVCCEDDGQWAVATGAVSPCYAASVSAPVARYTVRRRGPVQLLSLLLPRSSATRPPRVTPLGTAQGRGLTIETSAYSDQVIYQPADGGDRGGRDSDFRCAWIRRTHDGRLVQAVLLNGSQAHAQGIDLHLEHKVDFVTLEVADGQFSMETAGSVAMLLDVPAGIRTAVVNGHRQHVDGPCRLSIP